MSGFIENLNLFIGNRRVNVNENGGGFPFCGNLFGGFNIFGSGGYGGYNNCCGNIWGGYPQMNDCGMYDNPYGCRPMGYERRCHSGGFFQSMLSGLGLGVLFGGLISLIGGKNNDNGNENNYSNNSNNNSYNNSNNNSQNTNTTNGNVNGNVNANNNNTTNNNNNNQTSTSTNSSNNSNANSSETSTNGKTGSNNNDEGGITVTVKKDKGINAAIKDYLITNNLITDKTTITDDQWVKLVNTMKDIELQREKDHKETIFTGNSDDFKAGDAVKGYWHRNYVVEPKEQVTFNKDEFTKIKDSLGIK
jgi:hypothetical protein